METTTVQNPCVLCGCCCLAVTCRQGVIFGQGLTGEAADNAVDALGRCPHLEFAAIAKAPGV